MVAALADSPTQPQNAAKPRRSINRPSLIQRSKARTLYIVEQLSYKEISAQTGLDARCLQNMAKREGWITQKRTAKASVLAKTNGRIREQVDEVISAVALQTEELSLGTLAKASRTLDREDVNAARDLQAYSQAAKNFVGIARQARGLDAEVNRERNNGTTVIFVGELQRVGDAKRISEPKNVTPAQVALEASVTPIAPDASTHQ